MHGDIRGSRFLVIGGSSGIGLAVAMAPIKAGAEVTIASRSQARLYSALVDLGSTAKEQQLDTTDHAAVESFFATDSAWDHVVVSAAQTTSGSVRKLNLSDAHATMDSKFWGDYHVARSANIREHGSLCLISGFRSIRPSANTVLQGAMNAALEALARGLALEFAPVRVNVVSPGLIATPVVVRYDESRSRSHVCKCRRAFASPTCRGCFRHSQCHAVSGVHTIHDRFDGRRGRRRHCRVMKLFCPSPETEGRTASAANMTTRGLFCQGCRSAHR